MSHKTVSEVATLAGITVRALHHYDEIGLLRPRKRTEAGYRLYDEQDLVRLHDILLWRSLGFPLDEVRALIDDPAHDVLEALFVHRVRLVAEVGKLHERIAALVDAIRKARSGGAARGGGSGRHLRRLRPGRVRGGAIRALHAPRPRRL